MIVHYLDLETGHKSLQSGISLFNLTENNYRCDCNRRLAFNCTYDDDICGHKRFIVYNVEAEPNDEPFNTSEVIRLANADYYSRLCSQPRLLDALNELIKYSEERIRQLEANADSGLYAYHKAQSEIKKAYGN